MSEGVVVTVSWTVKADRLNDTIEMLRKMFAVTRLRNGFRNIRLLRSAISPHDIVLIEEWDEAGDFQAYVQFRTDTGEIAIITEVAETPPQIGIWDRSPLAEAA